jgi:C-terminal processing protease CtpA/Prc
MFAIAAFGLVLAAPAAPVPAQPPVPAPKAERWKAQEFARIVYQAGDQVAQRYYKDVSMKDLVAAAVRGMYEECNLTVPDRVEQAVRNAASATELVEALADVRLLLANQAALRGPRALFAAINGFKYATDPACQLVAPRANTFASAEMDFGVGIELEGVSGKPWMLYQVEYRTERGQYPSTGWLEKVPALADVAPPVGVPWRVRRVVPESPAQKAGVRPGDIITHFNGTEITGGSINKLFLQFAFPAQMIDPQTGLPIPPDRTLTFRRGSGKPFSVSLKGTRYTPMSAFGVIRSAEDKWDCMLDRKSKIGYIRIGAIETNLDEKVGEMLAELQRRGCRAMILDLRWCPGGYVDPGVKIAGMFLPNNAVIAQMKYRHPNQPGNRPDLRNNFGVSKYTAWPLVVLVGQETTGGGELIAAALRDNDRCVLMGQRTVGRASIQNIVDGGFGGLQFKVTIGESFRPNGKPRQRHPDSGPNDEWGLRPDEGLEVPVTLDKSKELRRWAELQALRPFGSDEALDFDDPDKDPYRVKALHYLRKKLSKPEGK